MQNKAKTTQSETDSSAFLQADKSELLDVISQQKNRIKILEEALRLSHSKRFAPSNEKSDGQERLFDEAEQEADEKLLPEVQPAQKPKKKAQKPTKADVALAYINKLYLIEREIKEASINEKFKARQKQSLAHIEKLRKWVDNNLGKVPSDSLTGKALTCIDNQWSKLMVYCEDGRLNISNVLAENAIRPFCIGRKAWLFSDTPKGAQASGVHYSFIETAKANDIEPYAYLVDVLTRLPYTDTVEKLEELLPWNFKKS